MRYDVKENYGKRAYNELQYFKKNKKLDDYNYINNNFESFKIYQSAQEINKTLCVNGSEYVNNVKIYSNSDKNYNNIDIVVKINDIVVYSGKFGVGVNVDTYLKGVMTLSISMSSDSEIIYDMIVEVRGNVKRNGNYI